MNENPADYFRNYRSKLGFTNQNQAKEYLAAKNITPSVDYEYIDYLNERIIDIVNRINSVIHIGSRRKDLNEFIDTKILSVYQKIKKNNIIPKLNNQGRRPEEVLFSWLRGFVISEYFSPCISNIFNIKIASLLKIGDLTICIHFDLYNGQVAFIRLDNINDDNINWVTRQQMEGQTVFSIDQNFFEWRLLDTIPNYLDLSINI